MPLHPLKSEWDADLRGGDPLAFPGYTVPEVESVRTGLCEVPGHGANGRYALVEGRFEVMGGSMGAAHGEKVVRAFRRATEQRLPVVVITRSGGARMQEGMVSLIQLARTAAAVADHQRSGLLSLSLHLGPTTGGVLASYGSLTDLRAAHRGSLIGFAGPRVVELTTGERLPETSHTAESAYEHGLVDFVTGTDVEQRLWVEAALGLHLLPMAEPGLVAPGDAGEAPTPRPWEEVRAARRADRPTGVSWLGALSSSWVPLRSLDPCIRAGLAVVGAARVVAIAMVRAQPRAEGFRLAQRAITLAGRLGLPLLTLIDTPGADPGPDSEASGIAQEIARTFRAMAELPSPSVGLCVGEGGSGGALALAATDRLVMLEHAVFSVISPEGAAAILDRTDAADAVARRAGHLRLTARDMVELGIADSAVPETLGDVAAAVSDHLAHARAGERRARFDAATARWLA